MMRLKLAILPSILMACLSVNGQQTPLSEPHFIPVQSELILQNTRILADGNKLSSSSKMSFFRASDGSTRLVTGDRVTIHNHKLHKIYLLNLADKIAQEIDAPAPSINRRLLPGSQQPPLDLSKGQALLDKSILPADDLSAHTSSTEDLGAEDVDGVHTDVKRVSTVVPAKAYLNNERPIVRRITTWRSNELALPIKTMIEDPLGGTTISKHSNIQKNVVLDDSLFTIPAGFTVRSGNQSQIHVTENK